MATVTTASTDLKTDLTSDRAAALVLILTGKNKMTHTSAVRFHAVNGRLRFLR